MRLARLIHIYIVRLIIDYPWYFLLLCLLAGAAAAVLLYLADFKRLARRQKDDGEQLFGRKTTVLLAVLRFVSVSAIAFLLLSPLVRREQNHREKPLVIIAQDNSKSLDYTPDSAYYHTAFQDELQTLERQLEDDYEVVRYTYGAEVRQAENGSLPDFSERATDLGTLLQELAERYYHRNVGALLLTGDGLYNKGASPVGVADRLTFPVYTVALGDTAVRRDATISHVRCNRIANLHNQFPMEITVAATQLRGEESVLTVSLDGKQLYSKRIQFADNHFSTTEQLLLDADKAGLRNYVVAIAPLRDEQPVANNRRTVPVEIIDGHQKIALIAAVPHPDVAALRRAIEQNVNYEVESFTAREFNKKPEDYNLLILHQLPTKIAGAGLDVEALLRSGTPALFVLGGATDLNRLNALHAGLEVRTRIDRQNEATALGNKGFTYFTLDDETVGRVEHFPPLTSPFGDYKLAGNAQTLFTARIGNVNSGQPLVAMAQEQGRRYAFIAGEGLWRWRLADWQQYATHDDFDRLIEKVVTFTALRVNKERLHVEVGRLFSATEVVRFDAQFYNDNYEPTSQPDATLSLTCTDSDNDAFGQPRQYQFNRRGDGYTLTVGLLPAGHYTYTATVLYNGKDYTASGAFVVEDQNLEETTLRADHALLQTLAATTGGAMLYPADLGDLPALLKQRDDVKTLIYSTTSYSNMLNMPLIFLFLVLLLGTEWVVRKYNGSI